jgi:hypothetical protein
MRVGAARFEFIVPRIFITEFTLPRLASYDLFSDGQSIDPVLGVKK